MLNIGQLFNRFESAADELSYNAPHVFDGLVIIFYLCMAAVGVWLGLIGPAYLHYGYLILVGVLVGGFLAIFNGVNDLEDAAFAGGVYLSMAFVVVVGYQAIDEKIPLFRALF